MTTRFLFRRTFKLPFLSWLYNYPGKIFGLFLGESLTCYKCKYERTLADCLANGVTTCTGDDDACFREEAEILRRHGPRVVSAGCGRSWRSANACNDHTGKLRCISWCKDNLCNGEHTKLAKIGNAATRVSRLHQLLSIISPLLLACILFIH